MNARERLLRRVGLMCVDFARQLSYHRALEEHVHSFKQSFWIIMYNNTIDLAVLDWFHLFGSHKDDLHWKQVVCDIDAFRNHLLQAIHMTIDEWETYWESIKDYRDKDVAHIEVRPVSVVPEMTIALRAVAHYYSVVLTELSTFGDYSAWPKHIESYYQKSLDQSKAISVLAYRASCDIREKVF